MIPDPMPVTPQEWVDFTSDDVKGRLEPWESEWLRDPENLEDWRDSLIELCQRTETHLAVCRKHIAQAVIDDDHEAMVTLYEQEAGIRGFRRKLTAPLKAASTAKKARDYDSNMVRLSRLASALVKELIEESEYDAADLQELHDSLDPDLQAYFTRLVTGARGKGQAA